MFLNLGKTCENSGDKKKMYFADNIKDYLKNFKQKLIVITKQDIYKFLIISILTIIIFAIVIYYYYSSNIASVNFTHLFYIPILLAAYWWNRNAIYVIIFIVLLTYIIYLVFFDTNLPRFFNFRSLVLLFVGIFVVVISEKKRNAEVKLKEINENLEKIIEEQTSEIKHANQKLQESEAKYRDLFENSIYIMYICDSKENFTEINMAGLQTLGYTKNEILGSNFQKFLTVESNETRENSFDKLMSNIGFEYPITLEIICKDGERKWLEVTERSIKNGNNIVDIHGIARDITDKIKLKKELNKSNKMRKLMCHLIEGDRGGRTRASILKHLAEKPYNANQLANILNMDYKTIRHHLNILIKNEIVAKEKSENYFIYYLSKSVETNIMDFI